MNILSPQGQTAGRKQYNLHSLLRAMADPSSKDGGYELETSQELARQLGRRPQGVFVPINALTRDLTVGSPTGGGNTVATNLLANQFVDLLRNRSIAIDAGATVLTGLQGNVALPRQASATTAYWVAESGAPIESAPFFDQVPMSPKTLSAFCEISRKMVLQSSLNISSFVSSDLAAAIGLGIDLAAINGSGSSNEPTGMLNTDMIQDFDQAGTVPTWADLVQLETEVSHSNGDLQGARMAYAMHPRMAAKLRDTLKTPGWVEGGYILEGTKAKPTIGGVPVIVSNQMPAPSSTTHKILFMDWRALLIGNWGVLDLLVDPYALGTSGGLRIVAMQDVDIALRNIESIAVLSNCSI